MSIRFVLDERVTAAFPDTEIRLIAAEGLRNDIAWPDVEEALKLLEAAAREGTWTPPDEDHPSISSWHDAYRSFGTNPRRSRPSVEALSRRLSRSGRLPRINSGVDAYNVISVRHALPAGAFDLQNLKGPVVIRPAAAGDRFIPLGEPDVIEEPKQGEIVYADGSEVRTRHWNHRDSDATKVTEATRAVVFLLERVLASAVSSDLLSEAEKALVEYVRPWSANVATFLLDSANPSVDVEVSVRQ